MGAGLRRGPRRVLTRLAELVCPPGLVPPARVVEEFELHLAHLPPPARRLVGPVLTCFDQLARLHPRSRGRRFVRLTDDLADPYLRSVLYGRRGPLVAAVRLIKSLLVMACYERPEAKASLGYDPATYIAEVAARRLQLHGPAIRAAEAEAASNVGGGE